LLLFVAFVRSRYPNADIVVDGVTYLPQDGEHTTNIGTSATKRAPEGMTLEDRRRYEGITRRHIRPLVGHAFFEPRAGRSDLAGPATGRAHRDASDRTRSALGLNSADCSQVEPHNQKICHRPRPLPRSVRHCDRSEEPKIRRLAGGGDWIRTIGSARRPPSVRQ